MLDGGFRETFDIYECIPEVDAPGLKFEFISEVTRHVQSLQVTIHVYTFKFEFIPEVDTPGFMFKFIPEVDALMDSCWSTFLKQIQNVTVSVSNRKGQWIKNEKVSVTEIVYIWFKMRCLNGTQKNNQIQNKMPDIKCKFNVIDKHIGLTCCASSVSGTLQHFTSLFLIDLMYYTF